jgi:hypothetical protein
MSSMETGEIGIEKASDGKIHRLRGMRTYLCGAMDQVADGGVVWRRAITPVLNKMGVIVLDPCNKPFEGGVEDHQNREWRKKWKSVGNLGMVRKTMKPIRTMDLRMVDISDFVITCIDIDVHMCGSYEEITTANRQKKPVLIWCVQGRNSTPDWLLGMLPNEHIFNNVNDLMTYLRHVDTAPRVKTYRRWFFPIFDVMYNSEVLGVFHTVWCPPHGHRDTSYRTIAENEDKS